MYMKTYEHTKITIPLLPIPIFQYIIATKINIKLKQLAKF